MATFDGKVVLVTGGATGIGRATCLAFAEAGAGVVIGDVDRRAAETAKAIEGQGGRALFVETDVVDPAAVNALVEETVSRFGGLHAAFNNAGILPPTCPVHEVTDEDFDCIMAVDVKGVFNALRAEIRYMLANGGGAIVNTASVAGVIADPGMSAYVAAKHAVVGLTKAAAIEYATQAIRVNAIAPGLVHTPMTQRWLDDPDFCKILMAGMPAGRAARPEEIAGTVLHLCSDAASFTNGQIAIIDGGQTAH
jgi:NAD(P)-dependent dehydrogenase (short-subunit alcohol dehydrogenase family)